MERDIFLDMIENDVLVEVESVKFLIGKNPLGKWQISFADYGAGYRKTFDEKQLAIEYLTDLFGSSVIILKNLG